MKYRVEPSGDRLSLLYEIKNRNGEGGTCCKCLHLVVMCLVAMVFRCSSSSDRDAVCSLVSEESVVGVVCSATPPLMNVAVLCGEGKLQLFQVSMDKITDKSAAAISPSSTLQYVSTADQVKGFLRKGWGILGKGHVWEVPAGKRCLLGLHVKCLGFKQRDLMNINPPLHGP